MDTNTDRLRQELYAVIGDVEELLKASAGQSGERIENIRAHAEESVRVARERLKDAAREMNGRVRKNPWAAVGIAAGIGLVAGVLLARK